jgi:hypothetical protein
VRRVLWAAAVLAAAAAVLLALTIPPARQILSGADDGTVVGVMHIHTNRSDGRSSPEEVAAAAARAGLRFIVVTDHGDATRTPDPPVYRNGVLCIDGIEISTTGGHYVAIGLPPVASPYPLGGEPRDVVEDVARLGGFGIASHPDSPKRGLAWEGWSTPFDGLEIINPDTSWRKHATERGLGSKFKLFDAILTYAVRGPETIASLLTDSSPLVTRWLALTRQRRVVAVAGTDAHALMGPLRMPDYEESFRMLSVHVKPDRPLSGDAGADADAIVRGIRAGHLYSTVDGFATESRFHFSASNAAGTAEQGDQIDAAGPLTLTVESNAPPSYTTTVWRDADVLATSQREPSFTVEGPADAAVYRVEIRQPNRPDLPPWLVSNPIYVRNRQAAPAVDSTPGDPISTETRLLFDGFNTSFWRMETGGSSHGSLDVSSGSSSEPGGALHVRYSLANQDGEDERVALLAALPGTVAPFERIAFTARADRPMRVSVQLRRGRENQPADRWQRSVYLDATARAHTIYFNDFTPIEPAPQAPILGEIPYILFVVDTANAVPGAVGDFWISSAALVR